MNKRTPASRCPSERKASQEFLGAMRTHGLPDAHAAAALALLRKAVGLMHSLFTQIRKASNPAEGLHRPDTDDRIQAWLLGKFDAGLLVLEMPLLQDPVLLVELGETVKAAAWQDYERTAMFAQEAACPERGISAAALARVLGTTPDAARMAARRCSVPTIAVSDSEQARYGVDHLLRQIWLVDTGYPGWRLTRRTRHRHRRQHRESQALWDVLLRGTEAGVHRQRSSETGRRGAVVGRSCGTVVPTQKMPIPPTLNALLDFVGPTGVRMLRAQLAERSRKARWDTKTLGVSGIVAKWTMYFWAIECFGEDYGSALESVLPGYLRCPNGCGLGKAGRWALLQSGIDEGTIQDSVDDDGSEDSPMYGALAAVCERPRGRKGQDREEQPVAPPTRIYSMRCPRCGSDYSVRRDDMAIDVSEKETRFLDAVNASPRVAPLWAAGWLAQGRALIAATQRGNIRDGTSVDRYDLKPTLECYDKYRKHFRFSMRNRCNRFLEVSPGKMAKCLGIHKSGVSTHLKSTFRSLANALQSKVKSRCTNEDGRAALDMIAEWLWHLRQVADLVTPEIGHVFPSAVSALLDRVLLLDMHRVATTGVGNCIHEQSIAHFAPTQKELELLCAHLGVSGLQHCCESVAEAKGMPCPARRPQSPASPPSEHGSARIPCKDKRRQHPERGRPEKGDRHKKRAPRAS